MGGSRAPFRSCRSIGEALAFFFLAFFTLVAVIALLLLLLLLDSDGSLAWTDDLAEESRSCRSCLLISMTLATLVCFEEVVVVANDVGSRALDFFFFFFILVGVFACSLMESTSSPPVVGMVQLLAAS